MRAAGLTLVLVLAACGPSAPEGGSPRASATLIFSGPREDCSDDFNPVWCERHHQFYVVDVRRDGDRIGVLALADGAQIVDLLLSDDGGRSFRHVGRSGNLIDEYAWDKRNINLLLRNGRAWLLLGTAGRWAARPPVPWRCSRSGISPRESSDRSRSTR